MSITLLLTVFLVLMILLFFCSILIFYFQNRKISHLNKKLSNEALTISELFRRLHGEILEKILDRLGNAALSQQKTLTEFQAKFDERQLGSLQVLQDSLRSSLFQHAEELSKRVERLTQQTDERLKEISGQVEKRLAEGFEKTTETFTNILKRLALIDEAQKKITELSSNVVSLQAILTDKRSRGAFGEIQLTNLIRNVLPEKHFALQHTLSNGKRADCILFLPPPTGNIVIDSKFPLESYQCMTDHHISEIERQTFEQQFKQDIRKHIQDIAEKYVIPQETSEGAIMFIPAEAIFAEIHAHFPELVELAHHKNIWIVSPTTMMAILTTIRSVLKDEATREQVHIIREHLRALSKDFDRFQLRIDNLAKHVELAHADIEQVHSSAKKITSRFNKIEKVELQSPENFQQSDNSTEID